MRMPALCAIALLTFCSTAGGEEMGEHERELLEADREWARTAEAGDLDNLWRFWADDAVMYLDGTTKLSGKAEIQKFVRTNRSRAGFTITWTPEGAVTSGAGDLGYTFGIGTITMEGPDGVMKTVTKAYVSIWRRSLAGNWECVVET